jgi:hypothetical protein
MSLENRDERQAPVPADVGRKQEAARIRLGWQCPECFGVNIENRMSRFQAQPIGFLCADCGCQFGSR